MRETPLTSEGLGGEPSSLYALAASLVSVGFVLAACLERRQY